MNKKEKNVFEQLGASLEVAANLEAKARLTLCLEARDREIKIDLDPDGKAARG